MIKAAVIGASGYIGSYVLKKYRETYPECIGTSFSNQHVGLLPFDLRSPDITSLSLNKTNHEAVLIASAIPNIAWCEANPKESYEINVKGTLKLVEQLEKLSLTTLFFSSDYVFDGSDGQYADTAEPNPNTEYGKQKAEVEREIPNLTLNYMILRLSKIYGTTWKDNTLLDSLASALLQGQTQTVAIDQFFSPTHIDDVVAMLIYLQENNVRGLVNLCHSNTYSRFQITQKLAEALSVSPSLIRSASLHSIPGMEKRPLNTSLMSSAILQPLQHKLLSLNQAMQRVTLNWALTRN